jgi:hypothetical protein
LLPYFSFLQIMMVIFHCLCFLGIVASWYVITPF